MLQARIDSIVWAGICMIEEEIDIERKPDLALDRRELLAKYGQYTAPMVVAILTPSNAYGHKTGAVYSKVSDCAADPQSVMGAMHGFTPHCMVNGGGGGNAHTITNP